MGRPQKGKIAAVIVISLLVIGFFLSIYITVDERIPGNAVVVVTLEDKLYHSIHFDHVCVAGKTAQTMTLSEAEAKGFKPHAYDEELGYFRGNRQFLFHHLLSKLGFPVNSRWDRNGNWLW
jgi:Na+/melibiose symporter-like transporter